MERTILHVDLNNFFASVEAIYNPYLRDGCFAVCGSIAERHGVVLAKNQKAKEAGVRTGMTLGEAKKLCSSIEFVEAHHDRYAEWSEKVKRAYLDYTDRMESYGIDEAWLDVTASESLLGDGKTIADEIRRRVKEEFGLTVSVGVSFNKIFAKLGSDMKKPDATTIITKENFKTKVWSLPVENLLFVGRSTLGKLKRIGINTIGELAALRHSDAVNYLGKTGESLWAYARGKDDSPVALYDKAEDAKSVGNSMTCYKDIKTREEAASLVFSLCESVSERVIKSGTGKATTLTLGLRDENLLWITRQRKLERPSELTDDFYFSAMKLLDENYRNGEHLRSIAVSVSEFLGEEQFTLEGGDYDKKMNLALAVDKIRGKYGNGSVVRGITFKEPKLRKDGAADAGITKNHLKID